MMKLVTPNRMEASAQICACFALRKTARAVTQFYDTALKPSGLRTTQYSLLVNVARDEPVGVSFLAEAMGMDQTTVTRNVRVLVSQGLLERVRGRDRRVRLLSQTDAGRMAMARAEPLWRAAQAEFLSKMGHSDWASLLVGMKTAQRASIAETQ